MKDDLETFLARLKSEGVTLAADAEVPNPAGLTLAVAAPSEGGFRVDVKVGGVTLASATHPTQIVAALACAVEIALWRGSATGELIREPLRLLLEVARRHLSRKNSQ